MAFKRNRLYVIWINMKGRCFNQSRPDYKYYGGRGITVCEEWHKPENFAKWANESGYKKGLWLDRIDTNGNYCPENCKWSTPQEQANNRRNNNVLTYCGESHTLAEWARILGVKKSLIKTRVWYGWSPERVIEQEVERHERKAR